MGQGPNERKWGGGEGRTRTARRYLSSDLRLLVFDVPS